MDRMLMGLGLETRGFVEEGQQYVGEDEKKYG